MDKEQLGAGLALAGVAFIMCLVLLWPKRELVPSKEPAAPAFSMSGDTTVYESVEEMPSFPGGLGAMVAFVQQNMQYPTSALRSEVQGTVYIEIIVNRRGEVLRPKVVKPLGFGLAEKALRLVHRMPAWQPGKQNGQHVNVRMVIPIKFRLQ